MANSYGQFTLWVSVSNILKSEHICTSHNPRASYQRSLVWGDLVHEICPHAATQSYVIERQCAEKLEEWNWNVQYLESRYMYVLFRLHYNLYVVYEIKTISISEDVWRISSPVKLRGSGSGYIRNQNQHISLVNSWNHNQIWEKCHHEYL